MKNQWTSMLTWIGKKPKPSSGGNDFSPAQVLEQLPFATLVVTQTGEVVFSNQAAARLAAGRDGPWTGTSLYSLLSATDHVKLTALLDASASSDSAESDVRLLNDHGHSRSLRLAVSRFNWHGEACHCVILRSSVPESVALRLAREQAQKHQQVSDNKSAFLASLSHEIRTPLSGMLGMIDLLIFTTLTQQQRLYVASLKKSARSIHGQINTVLDYSKIEAGLVETEEVAFDVDDVLRSVIDAFSPLASLKGLVLRQQQSLDHTRYLGDPHQIGKVLNNLVSNALKFTPSGSVTVVASTRTRMPQHDSTRLTLSVTDTGIGVPAGQHFRIFDSFAQASPSVGRDYGGSGLGLFISEQLVALMGGKISVVSEPGMGSTFTFWVDLQPHFAEIDAVDTAPQAILGRLAGARILVAEDDLTNRMLLEAWLSEAQSSVVCCADGQEVLDELAKGEYFDAILMDISMPKIDGLEATRRIRQLRLSDSPARQQYLAHIPIIGISGHVFTADVARCLRAGMTACLPKPLSRATMISKLSSVLALGHDDAQADPPAQP